MGEFGENINAKNLLLLSGSAVSAYLVCSLFSSYYNKTCKQAQTQAQLPSPPLSLKGNDNNDIPHSDIANNNIIIEEKEVGNSHQQFTKLIELIGEERFNKLQNKYVVIVGLGGIGSHAANCLVRSGIKKLRLIDFDQVTLSSLNRHAVATRADVGKPKSLVLKKYLSKITSNVEIEAIQQIFTKENSFSLLLGKLNEDGECDNVIESDQRPDFVIDCIDNVPTKVELLYFCKHHNIPVITTAGAGCRMDPTRLKICDLQGTCYDPLLRATRLRLSSKYKIKDGIPCVFSNERPPKKLLPLMEGEQEDDPQSFQTLPDIHMRVRIVPVLGPMPAIYGDIIAMEVVRVLSGLSSVTVQKVDKRKKKFYMQMISKLMNFEKRHHPGEKYVDRVSLSEVEYVVQELFHGKSAYSDSDTFRSKLIVVRWDKSKPPTVKNIVPLTIDEARKHYSQPDFSAWPNDLVDQVNAILQSGAKG